MAGRFLNRRDAGRQLAEKLTSYLGDPRVLVLGLPRGGVPVAYEVALALHAPLDVLVVRKLGVPGHPELAMGAMATGGLRVLNQDVIDALGIRPAEVDSVAAKELLELFVPGARNVGRFQIAGNQRLFQLETQNDVQVIGRLVRFDADE